MDFKITKNAQQLQLSGCGLKILGRPLLVVVEGKQKSVSRFERLMLRRIKWKEGEEEEDLGEDEMPEVECACKRVWSGVEETRFFRKFVWQEFENEEEARKFLNANKAGKFWDLVLNPS